MSVSKEMIELADEIESLAALDAHAGVGALCARNAGAIVAALRASAVAEPVRCFGCGSSWTDENLKQAKAANPVLVSCCPERKPLTIDQWQELALVHPAPAAPVPASVRKALEKIAKMCRPHASNEQFDGAILTIAEAALASLPAPEAAPTREEYATVLAQELWCGATFADAAPSEREAFLRAIDAILALKAAPAK